MRVGNEVTPRKEKGDILFVHRYIRPDVPMYGWMLPEIANAISVLGYNVDIFSTVPSYRNTVNTQGYERQEVSDNVRIHRIRVPAFLSGDIGKSFTGVYFTLKAFFHVLFGRYSLIMAATTPPVILAYFISLAARLRGMKFVYHCQDIHPEISAGQGPFRYRFIYRIFTALDRRTCKRANCIVVLSEDMKKSIVDLRSSHAGKIHIINNFMFDQLDTSEVDLEGQADSVVGDKDEHFKFIFSGNLGRFQGLSMLLDAMHLVRTDRPFELVFVGAGQAESALKEKAKSEGLPVRFLGQQPKPLADAIVRRCDAGIITLRQGLIRYAYPSKTLDYLTLGKQVLGVVDPDSSLATMIVSTKIGCVAEPGNLKDLATAMERVLSRTAPDDIEKARIQEIAKDLYGKDRILARWVETYRTLLCPGKDKK